MRQPPLHPKTQEKNPPGYRVLTCAEFVQRVTARPDAEERCIWRDLARIPAVRWSQTPQVTAYQPLTRW